MNKTNKSSKYDQINDIIDNITKTIEKSVEGDFTFLSWKQEVMGIEELRYQTSISCMIDGKHVVVSCFYEPMTYEGKNYMPASISLVKDYLVRRDDGTVCSRCGALRATIEKPLVTSFSILTLPDGHEIYHYEITNINDFHVIANINNIPVVANINNIPIVPAFADQSLNRLRQAARDSKYAR